MKLLKYLSNISFRSVMFGGKRSLPSKPINFLSNEIKFYSTIKPKINNTNKKIAGPHYEINDDKIDAEIKVIVNKALSDVNNYNDSMFQVLSLIETNQYFRSALTKNPDIWNYLRLTLDIHLNFYFNY
jgi:hypothetical protein